MLTIKAILYTLLNFSINIRLGFPALIYYTILLTYLIFLKVKGIVIVLLVEDITITYRGVNYL